jgi:hypothetical protein
MSISHSTFQAELEGAILQQTASVDLYLQTAAPKWSPECYDHGDGCGTGLRSLFLSDLSSGAWQALPFAASSSTTAQAVDSSLPSWTLEHTMKRRPRLHLQQVCGMGSVTLVRHGSHITVEAGLLLIRTAHIDWPCSGGQPGGSRTSYHLRD